jgi:hypothetical protein
VRRAGSRFERGSAVVEFAVLGTLIFGALIEVVVLFGVLHRASLATEAGAREVGRAVVVARSEHEASERVQLIVAEVERNDGLASGSLHASVDGARERGGLLRVRVSTVVPVVRIPFLGAVVPRVAIPVEATSTVELDPYRSGG